MGPVNLKLRRLAGVKPTGPAISPHRNRAGELRGLEKIRRAIGFRFKNERNPKKITMVLRDLWYGFVDPLCARRHSIHEVTRNFTKPTQSFVAGVPAKTVWFLRQFFF